MAYEQIKSGVVKRTGRRMIGLFIDGTGLDRATRRINRKVDMSALVRGVTSGLPPTIARYYTLIPYEDDYRQHAFLDAVTRAGLSVIVKRLPPKGISRQVSIDIEMAADIVAFAMGHSKFGELNLYKPEEDFDRNDNEEMKNARTEAGLLKRGIIRPGKLAPTSGPTAKSGDEQSSDDASEGAQEDTEASASGSIQRVVTVVCPGRDLSYPISLAKELGADTVTADFAQFNTGDVLKSAAKWIDLSDSETIWRE